MPKKKHILIIEDDSVFSRVLSKELEKEGFSAHAVIDGESGIRAAQEQRPDLIVLDIILPKKDGFEVMKHFSEHPDFSNVPVVVITNLEGSQDVEKMISLGAKAFLVKANYSLEEIVDTIERVIKSS